MTSEWDDACDPVPARRERASLSSRRAEMQIRRMRKKKFKPSTIGTAWVLSDFEEMGA